ncbi:MAG: radical SAM protein [Candidatus Lokiarchaeota archaeon]|nr:radical SAM protein [Candidatus Lokiarchaeota archaeon]
MYHLDGTDILNEKYYAKTKSVCPECLDKIDAEIVEEDGEIWMKKTCPEHGPFKDKISSSAKYYKWTHYAQRDKDGNIEWEFLKNGEANAPDCKAEDPRGCPYNCGLCDEHLSTCSLALIDLTNRCNFNCNFCYANVKKAGYLIEPSLEEIERVMKHFRSKEIPAPAIMFTGGEPSVRADFPEICKMAKDLGFKEVICATNGYGFQRKKGGLEYTKECFEKGLDTLYLQFDGINDATLEKTRGIKNLSKYKQRAIENCRKAGLTSVVLVQTVVKGITDLEIGNVIQYAIDNIDVVRGIVYQPVSLCGRITVEEMEDIRITNADVIKEVDRQTNGKIGIENAWYPLTTIVELGRTISYLADVEPIEFTCHPDCGFATYLVVDPNSNEMVPIMEYFDPLKIVDFSNKFWAKIKHKEKEPLTVFENMLGDFGKTLDKGLNWVDKQQLKARFVAGLLQYTKKPGKLIEMFTRMVLNGEWESVSAFTHGSLLISSMHFQDAYNMNIERTKRCIVHFGVAMPDGSVFEAPFCTMNTIHRSKIEKMVARKMSSKVENEFDTSKGERVLDEHEVQQDIHPEVAYNGGTKKGKKKE